MALKNIELFDLYVGKVFVVLYENFPLRMTISPCVMVGMQVDEETLVAPKQCEIFRDTVVWLEESGYIKYESGPSIHSFRGVVLSAKGLELLKATPDSLDKSLGDKMSYFAKHTTDEALNGVVNTLLSLGVKMFT